MRTVENNLVIIQLLLYNNYNKSYHYFNYVIYTVFRFEVKLPKSFHLRMRYNLVVTRVICKRASVGTPFRSVRLFGESYLTTSQRNSFDCERSSSDLSLRKLFILFLLTTCVFCPNNDLYLEPVSEYVYYYTSW